MKKVSRDKTEQKYGGNDYPKDAIGRSNIPNPCCCCCCCYQFGAVAITTENGVKINITTKFLTHNNNKNINQIRAN